jgi:hypothetical protein
LLALNNLVLVADMVVWREVDLSLWREFIAALALGALLYGFIWEAER